MTLHVSISDEALRFLSERAKAEGFDSPSQYLSNVVERQARGNAASLEQTLLNALDAGPAEPFTPGTFERMKDQIKRRAAS